MSITSRVQLFLGTSGGYLPILKAGYVLVAAALLALSQLGPEMIKLDHEAFKLKYEIEYVSKKSLEATDCATLLQHEPPCRLAQHQMSTLKLTLNLWSKFMSYAGGIGITLVAVGLIGWLMPLIGRPTRASEA